MSVLVDEDIESAIKRGDISIAPFDRACLGANSYDVHLAAQLLTYALVDERGYTCALDCQRDNTVRAHVIPEYGIRLMPGVLYLGSTIEYTEAHAHVPRLNGKSSLGRLGLSVHVTAGEGDVGFCGTWTLEMTVVHPLVVYAGMPVAQLLWSEMSGRPSRPYGARSTSKYRGQVGPTTSQMHRNFDK